MIAGAAAAVSGVWLVSAGRLERRAPAELVAVLRLLTLVAAAVLPIALTVCTAAVLSAKTHGGCELGYGKSLWLAGGLYLLALALGLRLLWVGARVLRSTRAAVVRAGAARLAAPMRLDVGRVAFVLPVREPLAYTAGLGRGQVVVSRGLLDLLDGDEREAVLAHEAAHARGGHQRMLFVGGVVAGAFSFLSPVRSAFLSLRRALEAAADAQAVAAVGDRRIVARAIAKAGLASAPAGVAPTGAGFDLHERIDRLVSPQPTSRPAAVAAAAAGVLVAGALIVSLCLAVHAGALLANVVLCLAALAALALPPVVRRHRVRA